MNYEKLRRVILNLSDFVSKADDTDALGRPSLERKAERARLQAAASEALDLLDKRVIGHLVELPDGSLGCVGPCCQAKVGKLLSPVYRINVGDYRQHCCVCDDQLVQGKTDKWVELYPGKLHKD